MQHSWAQVGHREWRSFLHLTPPVPGLTKGDSEVGMSTTRGSQGRSLPSVRMVQQVPEDLPQPCEGKDLHCPGALLRGWSWDAAFPAHVSVRMYRRIPLTTSSVSSLSSTIS